MPRRCFLPVNHRRFVLRSDAFGLDEARVPEPAGTVTCPDPPDPRTTSSWTSRPGSSQAAVAVGVRGADGAGRRALVPAWWPAAPSPCRCQGASSCSPTAPYRRLGAVHHPAQLFRRERVARILQPLDLASAGRPASRPLVGLLHSLRARTSQARATPMITDCSMAIMPRRPAGRPWGLRPQYWAGRCRTRTGVGAKVIACPEPTPNFVSSMDHGPPGEAGGRIGRQLPPVQEAGGEEEGVLDHVHRRVLQREVVERRDVPHPHRRM